MPLHTTIPFARVRFIDDAPKQWEIEERLKAVLVKRRDDRQQCDLAAGRIAEADLVEEIDLTTVRERRRIAGRAKAYLERLDAATGLAHLHDVERDRLGPLRLGVSITRLADAHEADTIASTLHEDMPWMGQATEHVWHAMRRAVRTGSPGLRLPPLLLVGPPGIGKSHWARRLGELLEAPVTLIDATGEPAAFALVGSQRGWSNAGPGRVLQTILRERCASPLVVVDEVEKAGQVSSSRGVRFTLTDGLLPLLEPATAELWSCPYYRIQCDMSWIAWVLTANSLRGLPEPLLSRCPPIRLAPIPQGDLLRFARREGARRGLPEPAIGAIEECLGAATIAILQPSLRDVGRMIDRAETLIAMPMLH